MDRSQASRTLVYRFEFYDILAAQRVLSSKLGTRTAIQHINGVPIGVGQDVDENELDEDGFFTREQESDGH
jgi:hypothetical protein